MDIENPSKPVVCPEFIFLSPKRCRSQAHCNFQWSYRLDSPKCIEKSSDLPQAYSLCCRNCTTLGSVKETDYKKEKKKPGGAETEAAKED